MARISHLTRAEKVDQISIIGANGDTMIVSGPGEGGDGVWLAPRSTGLFDMPFKTNWSTGMFGQKFQSWKAQRRDVVATFYIANPDNLEGVEDDPDTWAMIFSRWRNMWSPAKETTVLYSSPDGDRQLGLRLLQASKSVSTLDFEGRDPRLFAFGSVVQTMAAELPFYVGNTDNYEWEFSGTGNTFFNLPYFNPGDIDIWPQWQLTSGAKWWLPDYSYGNEEYGRGQADESKTVEFPLLNEGEDIDVNSRPDMQTIIAANDAPVQERMAGRDLEYPIAPGMGDPVNGCTVRVTDIVDGAACRLALPRWYSDPFSTPRIVA